MVRVHPTHNDLCGTGKYKNVAKGDIPSREIVREKDGEMLRKGTQDKTISRS